MRKKYIPKITSMQQLERLLANQKRKVSIAVPVFARDTENKKKRRLKKAGKDFEYFAKTYLPHYFTKAFNWHHKEMHAHAEKRSRTITAVAGARETGKTVELAVGYALHQALFQQRQFFIYIADTQDLAVERLIAIRAELESNPRIQNDFGLLENPGLWEMDDFTLKTGVRFVALGYKMSPRGKINGPQRPDFFLVDDFENKQTARNIKISTEKKEYILEECFGALDDNGNIVWLGNIPGKKCAMNLFREETESGDFSDKRFFLFYPLEFPPEEAAAHHRSSVRETGLLWPEEKPREYCDQLRGTVGTLAYEREYKLNPATEGRIFKEEWFQEYAALPDIVRAVMYTDPSFGKSLSACKKAVICLGWTGTVYIVVDAWIRHAPVTSMIEAQYAMFARWKDQGIGLNTQWVENNYGQLDRLKPDYDAAAKKHGFRIPTLPHENKEDKNMRIESNAGLIERGDILFNFSSPDQRELRDQHVYYPDHPDKDGPDALQSAVQVLDASAADFDIMHVVKRTFQRVKLM